VRCNRYASHAIFDDLLTVGDKLFVHSIGIALE
jgi:hypothetical protein